jgi:hypothetical protein
MSDRMRAYRAGVPWREFGMDAAMAARTRRFKTRNSKTRKSKATMTAAGKTAG